MSAVRGWPRRLFVSGTDTGVGKTLVAAALALGLEAVYWKPIQSGTDEGGDREWVRRHTGLEEGSLAPESYRLRAPLSPHTAAALEGVEIDLARVAEPDTERLVVEGAGGVLVPLNRRQTIADLIAQLGYPVVLVGRSGLGTINHTLLSLEALRRRQIAVWGVVLNGPRNDANRRAIEQYGEVQVVGEVPPLEAIGPEALRRVFSESLWGRR